MISPSSPALRGRPRAPDPDAGSKYGVSWPLLRALADSTDELQAMIFAINEVDRVATTGQPRLDLRRY
jgi:hypothetical protein